MSQARSQCLARIWLVAYGSKLFLDPGLCISYWLGWRLLCSQTFGRRFLCRS